MRVAYTYQHEGSVSHLQIYPQAGTTDNTGDSSWEGVWLSSSSQ